MTRSGVQSAEKAGSGGRLAHLLSPPAILLTPLVIFLKHHGYSLVAPEALISMALLAVLGVVLGIPGWIGGRVPAIVVLACILTLVVDIQLQWFSAWNFRVLGIWLAFALALWLLGKHLSTLLPAMAWALLLSSLVLPGNPRLQQWSRDPADGSSSQSDVPSAERPLMLHIVLDEQIGLEGIPKDFDPQNEFAKSLRTFYVRRGFRVFGRAYSRYYDSHDSIANLLNFSHQLESSAYYPGGFEAGRSMLQNDYFNTLAGRGYRIHVYQSDYMDFCNIQPEGAEDRIAAADACFEYALETISAIEHAPLAVTEKAKLIMGMFSRLAFLMGEVRSGYSLLVRGAAGIGMELPVWKRHMGRVSAVSTMPVFGRLQRDLAEAGPGSFYFAHLLLPHYPYAYDQHCVLRPNMKNWLSAKVNFANGRRNNTRTRAVRYPRYLEQVICTHRKLNELFDDMMRNGVFEDAIIIIQGDHGSRIDRGPPRPGVPDLVQRDFIDGFSTLYAIKLSGQNPGYDRRTLPIDELFTRQIRDGDLPPGVDWAPPPLVYMARPDTPVHRRRLEPEDLFMVKRRLPSFANGEVGAGGPP